MKTLKSCLQQRLSQVAGFLANRQWGCLTRLIILAYIKYYKVDMSIASEPNLRHYPTFNHFFTRTLLPSARPIDTSEHAIISPVDATVQHVGQLPQQPLRIKQVNYPIAQLLGDAQLAKRYREGVCLQAYLSPKDYHRVHMPLAGTLKQQIFIPGQLNSVQPRADGNNHWLVTNERLINEFSNPIGDFVIIMIGALNVGSIETVWGQRMNTQIEQRDLRQHYPNELHLNKGDEMARFLLGSAIVVLGNWPIANTHINQHDAIVLGQRLFTLKGKHVLST